MKPMDATMQRLREKRMASAGTVQLLNMQIERVRLDIRRLQLKRKSAAR